jgi:hypothetical protein
LPDSAGDAVFVTGASTPLEVDRAGPAALVTEAGAPPEPDSAGPAVFATGASTPPRVDVVGPAGSVAEVSAPPAVVLAGAAAVAAGATAPRAVDSTGTAVVVAGPCVTGDAVGGVVCAAGGPLRFGSAGAVLLTVACVCLEDDVVADAAGVCVTVVTSGAAAVFVLVTG